MQFENTPNCVIALSFGRKNKTNKDDPNKSLANLALSFDLPVVTQKEIASYLNIPVAILERSKGYFDTWQALNEAKKIMSQNSWDTALLVTHELHAKRALKQAVKAGLTIELAGDLPQNIDAQSVQWWTRSKVLWKLHELYTVPYLKIVGKI